MESVKNKITCINIDAKELNLLSLIELNCFNSDCQLPSEDEINDENSCLNLTFSPNVELNGDLNGLEFASTIELIHAGKRVGFIKNAKSYKNQKTYNNIFNANACKIDELLNPCISGQVSITQNEFLIVRHRLQTRINHLNAQKITALIFNADPLTRAHERIIRWAIDKADLVVIFVVEGYASNSLDFNLKKDCFLHFAQNYLPMDRIFPIFLQHIDLFNPYVDPNYECMLASSFGATKLVIGQNHQGLGMFYDNLGAHTAIDLLSKKSGLELIVLPELVFCTQCGVMVSTKSCPHGSHQHIKYRSSTIRDMLRSGLIPPTILVRKEISARILSRLHPKRFQSAQMIYDSLFPSSGLIEKHSDYDLYKELIGLYQTPHLI